MSIINGLYNQPTDAAISLHTDLTAVLKKHSASISNAGNDHLIIQLPDEELYAVILTDDSVLYGKDI